jgi:hypothetical protein
MLNPDDLTIGTRVRLRRDVDRYPHFVAPAGALGTVSALDLEAADCLVWVALDEIVDGADEWDNAVQFSDGDDYSGDLEIIPATIGDGADVDAALEALAESERRGETGPAAKFYALVANERGRVIPLDAAMRMGAAPIAAAVRAALEVAR